MPLFLAERNKSKTLLQRVCARVCKRQVSSSSRSRIIFDNIAWVISSFHHLHMIMPLCRIWMLWPMSVGYQVMLGLYQDQQCASSMTRVPTRMGRGVTLCQLVFFSKTTWTNSQRGEDGLNSSPSRCITSLAEFWGQNRRGFMVEMLPWMPWKWWRYDN